MSAEGKAARDAIERASCIMRLEGVHVYEFKAQPSTFRELQYCPGIELREHAGVEYLELMTCNGPVRVWKEK